MRSTARLVVERGACGSIVRELRSQAPVKLVPRRSRPTSDPLVVHLVNSATTPLGDDDVDLSVQVGPGARLSLRGTAATVALPGQTGQTSRARVRLEVAEGGSIDYLPQATVVTAGANHRAELFVDLAQHSRARCREVLVLGRFEEAAGRLITSTHAIRDGNPLLRQDIDLGDPLLHSSSSGLAGARVLATELLATDQDPQTATSGPWWSLSPLAAGGALASALAPDTVTAEHRLSEALSHHPNTKAVAVRTPVDHKSSPLVDHSSCERWTFDQGL